MRFSLPELKKYSTPLVALAVVAIILVVYYMMGGFDRFRTAEEEQKWREGQMDDVAEIIGLGDISKCDDVSYESTDGIDYAVVCRNNIALRQAVANIDISWCEKVDGNLLSVPDCQREVVLGKLRQEKNLSACDISPDASIKESCTFEYWLGQAFSNKNVSFCENIDDPGSKTSCADAFVLEGLVREPLSVDCSAASSRVRQDCDAFQSAVRAKGAERGEFCDKIIDARLSLDCPKT